MKSVIFLITTIIIFSNNSYAQIRLHEGVNSVLVYGRALGDSDESAEGSKYIDDNFKHFGVNGSEAKYLIRYNAYHDVMEYKANNNDILILSKEETKKVHNKEVVFELLNNNNLLQYHQILSDTNSIKLTRVQKINFNKAKLARNTYEEPVPASYKRVKDQYYIYFHESLYPFDGKQSSLIKIFPSKVDEIKTYYSKNKVDLSEEGIVLFKNLFAEF